MGKDNDAILFDRAHANQLVTVKQAARYLALSEWLVRQLIRDYKLPAVFIGGMTRLQVGDILDYIDACRKGGPVGQEAANNGER